MAQAPRLTSDLFVSALLRNAQVKSIFGGVINRGFSTAGAVHIVCFDRMEGSYTLFSPAPQMEMVDDQAPLIGGRCFEQRKRFGMYQDLLEFIETEKRFDSDLWVVELEASADDCADLFSLVYSKQT